ncbi:Methyltransferase domain-containing protein [Ruegeria intermedia]|uniref:Methyltransferase domain-containing protein n=1 Tax=Ruegeria intermedia TaxID=996115 RepID=A0A1M4YSG6_9RHOB|nr:class I SAM-dependent methyltransferase [Ruegeria intermedia]SHF08730.1 Methyltransferase domain-containing protein [Ruegeria intermedia]
MTDPRTIAVYDAQADRYADLTDADNTGDPQLARFIAAVGRGGRVLDLGCGPGASAVVMAQAGLRVEALDASAEMVTLAGRHPGVTARQAGFADLDAVATYDGVWANFSLLHAPRHDFPAHLAAVHRALRPGGVFFIAMKLGQGEGPDRLGRFYSYYSEDELKDFLHAAGFTVTDRRLGSGTGLDGSVSDWIGLATHA